MGARHGHRIWTENRCTMDIGKRSAPLAGHDAECIVDIAHWPGLPGAPPLGKVPVDNQLRHPRTRGDQWAFRTVAAEDQYCSRWRC